jgi:hypothetical protein
MARLYLPLDVMFHDDEKIIAVGERAAWLYLAMCCKAKQLGTGGYLTEQQVAKLAVPGWKTRLRPLLAERLVTFADDRYFIPAWANWNETTAQVAQRRRRDRERKAGNGHISSRNGDTFPRGTRDSSATHFPTKGSEVLTPQPPSELGGSSCAKHPDKPHPNCRGCATNSRTVQKTAKLSAVPAWCGDCQSDAYRWLDDDSGLRKCPRCHPSVRAS